MARIKDQAICVRMLDWSETSQIVVLLTAEHGLVRGLAKGSKRFSPSSIARFSGGIELLTGGQVVGNIKPNVELMNITEWDLQQPYRHLRQNLRLHHLSMYGADLVAAMLADHDPHKRTFDALTTFLEELSLPPEAPPEVPPEVPEGALSTSRTLTACASEASGGTSGGASGGGALLRFQWDILQDSGYRPNLDEDILTGKPLPKRPTYHFHPLRGGFSSQAARQSWGVRQQTIDLLKAVARKQPLEASGIDRANRLLCTYIRAILDRELPTMGFVLEEEQTPVN